MPATLRAIRGATTVDEDTPEAVTERVVALLTRIMERNGLAEDDIVSILFTATEDLVSIFPATAARAVGLGAVPLICARELAIVGSVPTLHPGHAARHHRPPEGRDRPRVPRGRPGTP